MITRDINSVKPRDATAEVKLLGSYDPEKQLIIEDTYYVSSICLKIVNLPLL